MLALALLVTAVSSAASSRSEPVRIVVDFMADGRCAVAARGGEFRADLTYLPPAGLSPAGELRCVIPSPPKGVPVELHVDLPQGRAPVGGEFPQLAWREQNHRWSGEASLPAAPAFVRVPLSRTHWWALIRPPAAATADDRITFGWNFYGWFIFALAFIATYFAWARRSARQT